MIATLVDLLETRAQETPDANLYTFLHGDAASTLTYAELFRRSTAIAAWLQRTTPPGAAVVNACSPGLDFITALYAVIASGRIAVPVPPPSGPRATDAIRRLTRIVADVHPACILTTRAVIDTLRQHFAELFETGPELVAVDDWTETDASQWTAPSVRADDPVLIQYTSGSTSDPKGVQLNHRNLLHNSATIHTRFGHDHGSRGCIWLPPYHDMGLIGGIFQPLYGRFPVTLMNAMAFVQRPLRWLRAVTDTRATTSGGPNFAYQLCVDRIAAADRATLDLSSWRVAFNGAEPINPATLDQFAEAFAPCGFDPRAFYPCYGLAEVTLFATGGVRGAGSDVRSFDGDRLATEGVAVSPGADTAPRRIVGAGAAEPDGSIAIVDPDTGVPVPDGRVGEVWFSGESAAECYWNRPAETAGLLHARMAGSDRRYVRTGDLGFLIDGTLFVTSRLRDMLIVAGRNIFPQDLERTSETSHRACVTAGAAVFADDSDGAGRVVIAQEIRSRIVPPQDLGTAIRSAIAREHRVRVHSVVLLPPGQLPRTPSGKVRRSACRDGLAAGTIDVIARV